MTLGNRIAALRKAAGLSQEALAAKLGVSRQAIGKWEADASLPGLDNLHQLAKELGVTIDALLAGADKLLAGLTDVVGSGNETESDLDQGAEGTLPEQTVTVDQVAAAPTPTETPAPTEAPPESIFHVDTFIPHAHAQQDASVATVVTIHVAYLEIMPVFAPFPCHIHAEERAETSVHSQVAHHFILISQREGNPEIVRTELHVRTMVINFVPARPEHDTRVPVSSSPLTERLVEIQAEIIAGQPPHLRGTVPLEIVRGETATQNQLSAPDLGFRRHRPVGQPPRPTKQLSQSKNHVFFLSFVNRSISS